MTIISTNIRDLCHKNRPVLCRMMTIYLFKMMKNILKAKRSLNKLRRKRKNLIKRLIRDVIIMIRLMRMTKKIQRMIPITLIAV